MAIVEHGQNPQEHKNFLSRAVHAVEHAKFRFLMGLGGIGVLVAAATSAYEDVPVSIPGFGSGSDGNGKAPIGETFTPTATEVAVVPKTETPAARPTLTVTAVTSTPTPEASLPPEPSASSEPSQSPIPTETATQPPEVKPFPEVIAEDEPFMDIFASYESIHWENYLTGDVARQFIPELRKMIAQGNFRKVFEIITNSSDTLLLANKDVDHPPTEIKENDDHKALREKVIIPLKNWIQQYVPEGSMDWEDYQKALDIFPWDWHPEVIEKQANTEMEARWPFYTWLNGDDKELGMNKINEEKGGKYTDFINAFKWSMASGNYAFFGQRLAYECGSNGDSFYEGLWERYFTWVSTNLSRSVISTLIDHAQQNNCLIPEVPPMLTATPAS